MSAKSMNDVLLPFASAAANLPPNLPDQFEILLKVDATPFATITAGEFRAAALALEVGRNTAVVADADERGIETALEIVRKAEVNRVDITHDLLATLIEVRRLLSYAVNEGKTASIRSVNANVAYYLADCAITIKMKELRGAAMEADDANSRIDKS